MDQITMLVTNIRTMYGTQGNYANLGDDVVSLGIVPAVMGSTPSSLTNPFKGSVTIGTYNFNSVSNSGFKVTYSDLPKEACIALATSDFGSGAGSGFIGVAIDSDSAPATSECDAYTMDGALAETGGCAEGSDITWFFY